MLTRRNALGLMAGAAGIITKKGSAAASSLDIEKGPFQATRESLKAYTAPEWFRDAKLGLWAHWGPQSAPEQGDWFAQRMYLEGTPVYKWHVENFGHPSKSGFKDVIPTFKAEKWEPEHLMDLYVKTGAKYFVSMGVHHDNFDMWNSKYQPRWNAVSAGPKRDIVGAWRDAARKRGLRFGVSEHLSNSFDWFAPAHRSDKTGPYAGVPYDGVDPNYADLYHSYKDMPEDFAMKAAAMGRVAPDWWKLQYFNRIKDLIDQHQPDLLYTDGGIPFDEYGLSLVAHHYNSSAKRHGGLAGQEHRFGLAFLNAAHQIARAPERRPQRLGISQGGADPGLVRAPLAGAVERTAGVDVGPTGDDQGHDKVLGLACWLPGLAHEGATGQPRQQASRVARGGLGA